MSDGRRFLPPVSGLSRLELPPCVDPFGLALRLAPAAAALGVTVSIEGGSVVLSGSAAALDLLGRRGGLDVVVVGTGGGET